MGSVWYLNQVSMSKVTVLTSLNFVWQAALFDAATFKSQRTELFHICTLQIIVSKSKSKTTVHLFRKTKIEKSQKHFNCVFERKHVSKKFSLHLELSESKTVAFWHIQWDIYSGTYKGGGEWRDGPGHPEQGDMQRKKLQKLHFIKML